MNAEMLIQAGDPAAALKSLEQDIRSKPSDPALRIFLFQLLAINGQWRRAQTQLELINDMDDKAVAMVQVYRDVINCELHREAVFQGQSKPLVMGEPEPWVAHLIEAQQAWARGDMQSFEEFNGKAFAEAPTRSGRINDEGYEWLADADQRFGPVLEVIFNQHYYWVPLERIQRLKTEEPTDLRDLIWLPAEITWMNGGRNMVMLPSRYPGVEGASGPDLLARHTDWVARGEGQFEGVGQKMLATDANEYPLLQVRSIEFDA